MDSPYIPIGERIAVYRRRRGLSQLRLGGLIDRSENWVSKVEQGRMPVDRISVLIRVADALHVNLADLLRDLRNGDPVRRTVDEQVSALTQALLYTPIGTGERPRDLGTLEADLDDNNVMREQGRFSDSAHLLPGMLRELHAAESIAEDEQSSMRVLRLLTRGYGLASDALARYGQTDAAWVAADRARSFAERTGDPGDQVWSVSKLMYVLISAGRTAEAVAAAERAIERARPDLADDATVRALTGALHLPLSVAAARQGDRGVVWDALAEADSLTRGPDRRVSIPQRVTAWTQYSPHNVLLHRVSTSVDLGDAGDALRLAEQVDTKSLSPNRVSRHHIDVALAHGYRRRTEGMVEALERAERVAPEQLHNFPLVREVVYGALRRERGHGYRRLHAIADRVGVT